MVSFSKPIQTSTFILKHIDNQRISGSPHSTARRIKKQIREELSNDSLDMGSNDEKEKILERFDKILMGHLNI